VSGTSGQWRAIDGKDRVADEVRVRPFDTAPSRPRLLARGLTRRCAWCGDRRAYFRGWFTRQERCGACGHAYRRGDEAFELGAVTANIILTFGTILVAILVLVAVTAPDVPTLGIVLVTGGIALVGPALFYPLSFTLWQAIDLWMRRPTAAELRGEGDARL
jgi:uncharacterized protein (DUF983 family)